MWLVPEAVGKEAVRLPGLRQSAATALLIKTFYGPRLPGAQEDEQGSVCEGAGGGNGWGEGTCSLLFFQF